MNITEAKTINSHISKRRGKYTAMLAPSCMSQTAQSDPLISHCTIVHRGEFFRCLKNLLITSYSPYQITNERIKAIPYPLILFITIEVMPDDVLLKTLNKRKVVETGIRSRVRMSNTKGAIT